MPRQRLEIQHLRTDRCQLLQQAALAAAGRAADDAPRQPGRQRFEFAQDGASERAAASRR
jgi:hypothetical protein